MAEPTKADEFPQTGADEPGQISPPMGEFWLPHDNATLPGGFGDDFDVPTHRSGFDDVHIPDYHPPERIPDHPFKVNRYYDNKDKEWKIRVREGRFYLTTNNGPTVTQTVTLGPSDDGGDPPVLETEPAQLQTIFTVTGDDGFPSFGNSNASLAPALALPKEFTDSDAAHGYAFFGDNDNYNPAEVTWVYLRYILKHNTTGMELAGSAVNKLNVITIPNSSHAHAVYGAVNKPINAAAVVDKGGDDGLQLMRADQTVAASLNGLAISGDRERYGVYYILLAKVEPTSTATGPLVTQYIHENITLSVSNTPVTAYSDGYGEA